MTQTAGLSSVEETKLRVAVDKQEEKDVIQSDPDRLQNLTRVNNSANF